MHQLPPDLKKALTQDPEVLEMWEEISPLARNEWICWVESAKKTETRNKRIEWGCSSLKGENAGRVAGLVARTVKPLEIKSKEGGFIRRVINIIISFSAITLFIAASSALAIQESSISGLGANKSVHADLIIPDGQGPFPGVLILHTAGGVQKYDIDYAHQLAQKGYACLVPHYFDAYGISNGNKTLATSVYADRILADFTAEIEFLNAQPKIDKSKIGAVGFSMGGYWALVLAGMDKVRAGVSYYGAMTGRRKNVNLKYSFEGVFSKSSSPVLILHGKHDMKISVKDAEHLGELLKERGCVYELHIYPQAGHRFERGKSLDLQAASDSLNRTLSFLRKYLK